MGCGQYNTWVDQRSAAKVSVIQVRFENGHHPREFAELRFAAKCAYPRSYAVRVPMATFDTIVHL